MIRQTIGAAALALLTLSGCVTWTSGWEASREMPFDPPMDVQELRARAMAAAGDAHSAKGVLAWTKAWKDVLRASPDDPEALATLASAWTLAGAGHARTQGEKGEFYRNALQAAERLMARDEGFRDAVGRGAATWDAVDVLGKDQADAMGWWATALVLYYDECQGQAVQATNLKWLRRATKVLDRLDAVAPGWNGGGAAFARALVALHLPEEAGGGTRVAANLLDGAAAAAPDQLRTRWARARWLAPARADDLQARAENEWVAARDPKAAPGAYPWNVLYVRDAKVALNARENFLYW